MKKEGKPERAARLWRREFELELQASRIPKFQNCIHPALGCSGTF
jgi:hypothetical protein